MSKRIKKKAKKTKKVAVGILPVWCNCSNLCCVALLALILGAGYFGGIFTLPGDNGLDETDDTDDADTTTTTPVTPAPVEDEYVLEARLNSWSPLWPNPGMNIEVEVFDAATSSKVHTGRIMDTISIAYNYHEWVRGTPHSELISGFMVTIQVWGDAGNLMLTVNDYIDIPVGSAEATYNLYEPVDLGFAVGSVSLRWVRV